MKRLLSLCLLGWSRVAAAQEAPEKNNPPVPPANASAPPPAAPAPATPTRAPEPVPSPSSPAPTPQTPASTPTQSWSPDPAHPSTPEPAPPEKKIPRWGELRLAGRGEGMFNDGYGPYQKPDDRALASLHLGGSATVARRSTYDLRVGFAIDGGGSKSFARDYPSELVLFRTAVPVDVVSRAWGDFVQPFVRLAPGAAWVSQSVTLPAVGTLKEAAGTWMLDASVGTHLYVDRMGANQTSKTALPIGFGFLVELGYGLTGQVQPKLVATDGNGATNAIRTPAFSANSPFVRLGCMLTF